MAQVCGKPVHNEGNPVEQPRPKTKLVLDDGASFHYLFIGVEPGDQKMLEGAPRFPVVSSTRRQE
jgi:hypothetical protein